jgi:hypothetical protein
MSCSRPRDRQPDLFAPEGPLLPAAAAERRTELLAWVSALLTEALTAGAGTIAGRASDEDHA